MRNVPDGRQRDRGGARPLERLRRSAICGLLTVAAAVGTAAAEVPTDLGAPSYWLAGQEPMRERSGSAGPSHAGATERYEFAQATLSWGALGSGYSSEGKLVAFIVVRYASRPEARRAAMQECARRQLTDCEIPIVASGGCLSIVRNGDRSWFQAGTDAGKLTAELLRECREEGDGSMCYVSQLVCMDD